MTETTTDNTGDPLTQPQRIRAIALALVIGLTVTAIYWDTVAALAHRWSQDDNYGHGFIVPIVSIYLAWQVLGQKRKGKCESANLRGGVLIGSLLIVFGFLLSCTTLLFSSGVAGGVSLVMVLAGLTLMIGGREWWGKLWAPIFFLLFMVPLPSPIYSRIAFPLQLFVSQISAMSLEVMNVPVMLEGNLLHLSGQTMYVAEACSGLRQLMAFLAVCTCAALIMQRPTWYRFLILGSAIPIAIVVNIFRVTVMGLMLHMGRSELTQGWMHTAEGLIMVSLGLGLLMLELSIVDWLLVSEPPSPIARGNFRQETAVA